MGSMGREFKESEKALLIVLAIILCGSIYYLAVDRPVRKGVNEADAQIQTLSAERDAALATMMEISAMEAEMSRLEAAGEEVSMMPSYNSSKTELEFLNNTLSGASDYYIGFSEVTRDGDQIRRGFSLQYRAKDYDAAEKILNDLESSPIRCVIGDLSVSPVEGGSVKEARIQVSAAATFFETMVGGTPDNELPEDKSEEEEAQ